MRGLRCFRYYVLGGCSQRGLRLERSMLTLRISLLVLAVWTWSSPGFALIRSVSPTKLGVVEAGGFTGLGEQAIQTTGRKLKRRAVIAQESKKADEPPAKITRGQDEARRSPADDDSESPTSEAARAGAADAQEGAAASTERRINELLLRDAIRDIPRPESGLR